MKMIGAPDPWAAYHASSWLLKEDVHTWVNNNLPKDFDFILTNLFLERKMDLCLGRKSVDIMEKMCTREGVTKNSLAKSMPWLSESEEMSHPSQKTIILTSEEYAFEHIVKKFGLQSRR
jgi:hypothetical protein